jgi:hypothetical protein
MAYFTHNPYDGRPYLDDEIRAEQTVYCDKCAEKYGRTLRTGPISTMNRHGEQSRRWGWAPIYGKPCADCGKAS